MRMLCHLVMLIDLDVSMEIMVQHDLACCKTPISVQTDWNWGYFERVWRANTYPYPGIKDIKVPKKSLGMSKLPRSFSREKAEGRLWRYDSILWLWAHYTKSQLLDPFHLLYPIGSMYGILWYIYLHLVDFYGKCRELYHTYPYIGLFGYCNKQFKHRRVSFRVKSCWCSENSCSQEGEPI